MKRNLVLFAFFISLLFSDIAASDPVELPDLTRPSIFLINNNRDDLNIYIELFIWNNTGLPQPRFRDLPQMVSSLMGIMFLITPIIWQRRFLGENQIIAIINPFTHMITMIH